MKMSNYFFVGLVLFQLQLHSFVSYYNVKESSENQSMLYQICAPIIGWHAFAIFIDREKQIKTQIGCKNCNEKVSYYCLLGWLLADKKFIVLHQLMKVEQFGSTAQLASIMCDVCEKLMMKCNNCHVSAGWYIVDPEIAQAIV